MSHSQNIIAIDQGTSSTRCLIINEKCETLSEHQMEHRQIYLHPGWVEHDPKEIWCNVQKSIEGALAKAKLSSSELRAIGITNQRESTLIWNRHNGEPYYNVIVWNDARSRKICDQLMKNGGKDKYRKVTGLPIAPYFSISKILWLFENIPGLKTKAEEGEAIFGTIDTWLIWKLTNGNKFITDVTNASRTLLMNVETLKWDQDILNDTDIPLNMLPSIKSSSELYGIAEGILDGVPIAGVLGDQQSALFGQTCFEPGSAKCTYGTGSFVLMNTGKNIIPSTHGLLSTVGYKLGTQSCVYALEGSVAYCGSTVQWLRDNIGIIKSASDMEPLSRSVTDNGGVYFVPAFSGLFAPRWSEKARGTICGLTSYNTKAHLARAVLESTAFQVHEVLEAMKKDSNINLTMVKVDGGMTANKLLLQFQADLLDVPVITSNISETTAFGAAFAAGLAMGVWNTLDELQSTWKQKESFEPEIESDDRNKLLRSWEKAVSRSLNWVDTDDKSANGKKKTNSDKKVELNWWIYIASAAAAFGAGVISGIYMRKIR